MILFVTHISKFWDLILKGYLFTTQFKLLTTLKEMAFENNVGKGENAG